MLAPAALADGDPASDVLVDEQLFYPSYTTVAKAQLKELQATAAAEAARP